LIEQIELMKPKSKMKSYINFYVMIRFFSEFFQLFFTQALFFAICSMKNTCAFNIYMLKI